MIFLILIIQVLSIQASNSISSFPFQNGDWYNRIERNPSSTEYQTLVNQFNNTVLINFQWNSNGITNILGDVYYVQTKYFPLRMDNMSPLVCSFYLQMNSLNLFNYRNISGKSFFTFDVVSNHSLSSIGNSHYQIQIIFANYNMNVTGQFIASSISLNNNTFTLYNKSIVYLNTMFNYNGSLIKYDFNQFFQDLIKRNLIFQNDYVMSFKSQFDIYGGSGNFSYHQDFPYSTYHYYDDAVFIYDDSYINIQLFNKNFTSTDYCNTTFVDGSTGFSNLIIDYYFSKISNHLKASLGIAYGYINNTWVTPIDMNSLPTPVDSNYSIYTTYSFNHYDYNILNERIASCWVILIRSDFNPNSQTFTYDSSYPSREIYICPYWSSSLTINAQFVMNILYNDTLMKYFNDTNQSPDLKYTYPSHTFIYQNNTLNPDQIDLMAFVRWIYKRHNISNQTDYVVGIQEVFRIHSGKGNFSFVNQAKISNISRKGINISLNLTQQLSNIINATSSNRTQNITSNTTSNKTQNPANITDILKISSLNSVFHNPLIQNSLLGVVSIPNIGLILQGFQPFIDLMNQLSYYDYHKRNYSTQISQFYDLVNNLLNSQWIPSFFQSQLNKYYLSNLNYSSVILQNDYNKSTEKIIQAGQDIYFIKNMHDYLVSSTPISLIMFFVFMLFYNALKISLIKKLLQNFSSISFLIVSIIGQNVQYISFWGFTQFYFFVPIGIIGGINLIITVIFIFISLIFSVGGYFSIRYYIGHQLQIIIDGQNYCVQTIIFIAMTCVLKFTNGFIHGYLYHHAFLQILFLFLTNFIYCIVVVIYRTTFISKIFYYSLVLEWLAKIIMHIFFIYEYFLITNNNYTDDQNIYLGRIELYLIYCILVMATIRFLYSITLSLKQLFSGCCNSKQKKKVELKIKKNKINIINDENKRKIIEKISNIQSYNNQNKKLISNQLKQMKKIKRLIIHKNNIFNIQIIQKIDGQNQIDQ